MTNKCTIISQIITLLHVATLSCHLQGALINALPSYTGISNAAVGNTVYNCDVSRRLYASSRTMVTEISILKNH